tara:strand:+ start:3142 stop:3408 length:267 start_codon:yes stop_codon:yes gene_type:complete
MGCSISTTVEEPIIQGEIIGENEMIKQNLIFPTNPGNDFNHQYYWKLMYTNSANFVKIQEEGFVIATNKLVKEENCHLWLRKKKTNKI